MAKTQARMESRWRRALRMAGLGGVVGFGAGLIITAFVGAMAGTLMVLLPFLFAAVAAGAGYLYGALAMEGAADLAQRLYMGGQSVSRREFSHAQAMAARGDYHGALEAYGAAAEEFPDDAGPLLQGARVLRDELKDYRRAEAWYLKARQQPLGVSERITIVQELVDLYDGPLEEPRKALPLLARLAEEHPGTSVGEWAGRRLARLRTEVWEDVKEREAPAPPRKPPPKPDPTL